MYIDLWLLLHIHWRNAIGLCLWGLSKTLPLEQTASHQQLESCRGVTYTMAVYWGKMPGVTKAEILEPLCVMGTKRRRLFTSGRSVHQSFGSVSAARRYHWFYFLRSANYRYNIIQAPFQASLTLELPKPSFWPLWVLLKWNLYNHRTQTFPKCVNILF